MVDLLVSNNADIMCCDNNAGPLPRPSALMRTLGHPAAICCLQTRETALAEVLKGKIAQYVGGDKAGFRAGMEQEAVRLSTMPFGNAMLDHIG